MKYSVLCALLFSISIMKAIDFSPENKQVVVERWREIFNEECATEPDNPLLMFYRDILLSLNEEDVQVALTLIAQATQEPEWETFRVHRDEQSVLQFAHILMQQLRDHVGPNCSLSFPPRLQELDDQARVLGIKEEDLCTRVRQAFLAFTITVSLMSQMSDAL